MPTTLRNTDILFNDSSTQPTAATGFGFKNRIINGAMMIDQRNAGASISLTAGNVYPVDRFLGTEDTDGTMTAEQVQTAPAGFTDSLLFTTGTADSSLAASQYAATAQLIEGFNVADLGWGTANAQTVTLSFWVRSSLTGTFSGSLRNSAGARSYVFTYSISAANTFEYKTITIAGDTSGTWLKDNGVGIRVWWSLGTGSTFSTGTTGSWVAGNFLASTGSVSVIGTAGATFYITGVQLEKGSTATSFDYRPYGTELMLCQRYYQTGFAAGRMSLGATEGWPIQYKATMRATPSITFGTAVVSFGLSSGPIADNADTNGFTMRISGAGDHGWTGPYGAAIEL